MSGISIKGVGYGNAMEHAQATHSTLVTGTLGQKSVTLISGEILNGNQSQLDNERVRRQIHALTQFRESLVGDFGGSGRETEQLTGQMVIDTWPQPGPTKTDNGDRTDS